MLCLRTHCNGDVGRFERLVDAAKSKKYSIKVKKKAKADGQVDEYTSIQFNGRSGEESALATMVSL